METVNIINGFLNKAERSITSKGQTNLQISLPAPVDDVGKLSSDKMLSRYNEHVSSGVGNLFDKHVIHRDRINMTLNGFIGYRTDAGDNLMPSHKLHILKIMHVCCIRMDVINSRVTDFFYNAGNIAIVYMCKPGCDFNMFHSEPSFLICLYCKKRTVKKQAGSEIGKGHIIVANFQHLLLPTAYFSYCNIF